MLIKKELETIPLQPYPKKLKNKNNRCVAVACTNDLKRSGKVLIVDIFTADNEKLYMRFFSDGKTFIVCDEWPANKWRKNALGRNLNYMSVEATEKDSETAYLILKDGIESYWCNKYSIKEVISAFAYKINSRKREQAQVNKYALMDQHFAMFPEYPADLREFCETNVFKHTYIFVSKCTKNKRQAVCGHCGNKYEVDKSLKPGTNGYCRKCGMRAAIKGDWTGGSYEEKANICIAQKHNDQLLIRWAKVKRTFSNGERIYNFEDFYRNLYLKTEKGNVIYAYQYQSPGFYYGWQWYRKRNNEVYYGKSFVYTDNMRETFGKTYYNVDLQNALKNAGEISFVRLLDNLKNIPATEYLVKMKLTTLAADISKNDIEDKQGFSGVLGVSKQYLPMYQKYNVNVMEHHIIKASRTWVSEENFEKFKKLQPESWFTGDIVDLLQNMSFEKFVNYFTKQAQLLNISLNNLITLYRDYLSMSKSLYVDMDRKSVRFPDNIKESHDLLRTRYNEIKIKIAEETYKQAMDKISSGMEEYADKDYCIVLPTTRGDFIREGQSLNHCVGSEGYFNNHIKGTKMIFFIRKLDEPEKPYYTMEVDMKLIKILQLYGFGDCSATPEVRKFANSFVRKLLPNSQEERKAS